MPIGCKPEYCIPLSWLPRLQGGFPAKNCSYSASVGTRVFSYSGTMPCVFKQLGFVMSHMIMGVKLNWKGCKSCQCTRPSTTRDPTMRQLDRQGFLQHDASNSCSHWPRGGFPGDIQPCHSGRAEVRPFAFAH